MTDEDDDTEYLVERYVEGDKLNERQLYRVRKAIIKSIQSSKLTDSVLKWWKEIILTVVSTAIGAEIGGLIDVF